MSKTGRVDIWAILDSPVKYDGEIRTVTRPVIHHKKVILTIALHLIVTGLVAFALSYLLGFSLETFCSLSLARGVVVFWAALASCLLLLLVRLKRILIFFILVYQAKAPYEVRVACVFTPSCSEYMKLSLEKYGVIRGVRKGVDRLLRCYHPNGGEDYP